MRSLGRNGCSGWTLLELVVALVLMGLIGLSSITFFSSVSREIVRPVLTYGGDNYTLAPVMRGQGGTGTAQTDIFDAIDLHREFSRQTQAADLVIVFGGANVDAGAPAPLLPLDMAFSELSLPSIGGVSPQLLQTANQVAAAANADLGARYVAAADAADFTVLAFQGLNQIVMVAQVRRYFTTFEDRPVSLYETTLRSRTLPSATWTTYAYRFWLPANEDVWSLPVGARHYWYRYEAGWWGRNEQTGASVVFPDPYVLSVNAYDARVLPVSRFSYFLSTSP